MIDGEAAVIDKPDTATDTGTTDTTATTETATTTPQTAATDTATETGTETTDTGAKTEAEWADDWRERMSGGDEDIAKVLARYGSPKGVAKALRDTKALVSSGKLKRDMPDASDEKAMAEWRKSEGIPDDPTGYVLPETVTKRMTDADKPMLANFTEYAHSKGRGQDFVAGAAEWYFDTVEAMEEQRLAGDNSASEACEDALRKDWAHGEYKANLTLGKRFMEAVPGIGANWTEARLPDGRRIGDIPEFVSWAADMGRERFGDATFADGDSERRHTTEKEELETLMKTDIGKYYETGSDKKYLAILEKEQKRARK